jgi:ribosomal protein L11 methyltransferase
MFSLEIECGAEDREFLVAELWELGCEGIVELAAGVRVFFADTANWRQLDARFPGAVRRKEEDRDWVQSARDLLQPMEVGQKFFLVPAWRDDPAPAGRFRIEVNPGMAFGTGVHETTQLAIEALERRVEPGSTVLDVGTGSGILAEAARLLGAGRIFACDTDPVAIQIAGCGFVGSVDAVRSRAANLVIANISPEAILGLAADLLRVLRPGGVLLASGFEAQEVPLIQDALPVTDLRMKGSWALVEVDIPRFSC